MEDPKLGQFKSLSRQPRVKTLTWLRRTKPVMVLTRGSADPLYMPVIIKTVHFDTLLIVLKHLMQTGHVMSQIIMQTEE